MVTIIIIIIIFATSLYKNDLIQPIYKPKKQQKS